MSIRTKTGALNLDATDFQFTHQGVTIGLELSVTPGPDMPISAIVIAEKNGSTWETKELLAFEFDNQIEAMGITKWIETVLLPRVNGWLSKRFAGAGNPDPLPDWVPSVMADLDATLGTLRVTVRPDGVPQVSLGT